MMDYNKRKGMRFIILDILQHEKLHGYGIAERIARKYGIKKPSSGIIYPVLSSLKKSGLVKICDEGKRDKKIYELTDKGEVYLKEHHDKLEEVKRTLYNIGEFRKLGGDELLDAIKIMIKNINKLDDSEKKELESVLRKTSAIINNIAGGKQDER